MPLISRAAVDQLDTYADSFRTAQPFRYVVLPEFFEAAFCERLRIDFPSFDRRHALNEMGEVGGKAVRMDVRDISPVYRELDAYLQTPEFLDYVSALTGIPDLLYDPDYVGGGTHENHDGQGLDTHVDFNYHPRTRTHRRLNLIVYLNPEWEDAWGGNLDLHADPWHQARDTVVSVPPLFNHAAIFETTERSWHGFSQIKLPPQRQDVSRKSFAIYLYTHERPAAKTAPPHATIYVPEGMPATLTAGHVLDVEDVQDLHRRFTRMRTQLRHLYDREKDFGEQIQGYEYALGEARAAQRLDLQGYATQDTAPEGLWPDSWAGENVTVRFVPTRKVKALTMDLWAPAGMADAQELRIELNGKTFTQQVHPGRRTPVKLAVRIGAGEDALLRISAAQTFQPSADGRSADERALAYRIISASLLH